MTLTTTASRVSYPGAGSTGPFAFPFTVSIAQDLLVTKRSSAGVETVLVNPTDYSVTGLATAAGSVTLVVALQVGETLFIRRKPANTQTTSIRNQGTYFPATIEDELDRLTMQLQALQDSVDRSVKLKETINGGAALTELDPTAGKVVAGTGTGFTMSTLDSSAVALPGGARTVSTLSAYLANNAVFQVKDYGVTWDGVADDTTKIQNCIGAANGAPVILPPGTGLFSSLSNVPGKPLVLWGTSYQAGIASWIGGVVTLNNSGTVLQTTATANIAIGIAQTASATHHDLRDFILLGNPTNLGGIAFGTAAFSAAFTRSKGVRVLGFSGVNAYGISLNTVQEFDAENLHLSYNYNNIYRPPSGTLTSTRFHGMASYCGLATNRGVQLDGQCYDIRFQSMVFESSQKEAIQLTGPGSVLIVDGCYFENNAIAGGDIVTVAGASGNPSRNVLIFQHNKLVSKGRVGARWLNLDYLISSRIICNPGLWNGASAAADVIDTAACQVYYADNADGADVQVRMNALLGQNGWSEVSQTGISAGPGRAVSLPAIALALVQHSYANSADTNGWRWMQDEAVTGDHFLYRRVASVDTLVARFKRSDGTITWSAAQVDAQALPSEAVLVSGVDASTATSMVVVLTAARLVGAPLNPKAGQRLVFVLVQNGTGAFAVTWNAIFKGLTWSNAGNAANTRSTIAFVFDGTYWSQETAQTPWAL